LLIEVVEKKLTNSPTKSLVVDEVVWWTRWMFLCGLAVAILWWQRRDPVRSLGFAVWLLLPEPPWMASVPGEEQTEGDRGLRLSLVVPPLSPIPFPVPLNVAGSGNEIAIPDAEFESESDDAPFCSLLDLLGIKIVIQWRKLKLCKSCSDHLGEHEEQMDLAFEFIMGGICVRKSHLNEAVQGIAVLINALRRLQREKCHSNYAENSWTTLWASNEVGSSKLTSFTLSHVQHFNYNFLKFLIKTRFS